MSATFLVPLVGQTIWNQLPVTSTGSEKENERFAFVATAPAPDAGIVAITAGARSATTSVTSRVPTQPWESVAVTVNGNVPPSVGVPDSTPAAENVTPAGNVPISPHVIVPMPPP